MFGKPGDVLWNKLVQEIDTLAISICILFMNSIKDDHANEFA